MGYRRVVGLGLCVVDHTYLVGDLAGSPIRTRYTQRRVSAGGMTTTALCQAARLGCDTWVLSAVGDEHEKVKAVIEGAYRSLEVKVGAAEAKGK